MNRLRLGIAEKDDLLDDLPERFFLVDDGRLIQKLPKLPNTFKVTRLDFTKHFFNPLAHIDYEKACALIETTEAVFPQGQTTLTTEDAGTELLEALLSSTTDLERLIPKPTSKNAGQAKAYNRIKRLLLSPVLNRFLTTATNFSLDGILILDPTRLVSRPDAFLVVNLLMAYYPHEIIISDYGQFASPFHSRLLKQERLRVGLNFLGEVLDTRLRNQLVLIKDKVGHRTTADDAETLANFSTHSRGSLGRAEFIEWAMR